MLIPVLVTTIHRGVFFGFAEEGKTDMGIIKLKDARNCIYWSKDVGGFLGLAFSGPTANCRIGAVADIQLSGITCIANVSDEAVIKWRNAPCYKG